VHPQSLLLGPTRGVRGAAENRGVGPLRSIAMAADAERDQLLDTIETDLADVELALARLDADTYFTCQRCAQPLSEAVLAERPTTRTCCE